MDRVGVVFVCTGNICRSPMAEGMLRVRLKQAGLNRFWVSSMGIRGLSGSPASEKAVEVCSLHGVDISGHVAREMDPEELSMCSIVLGMAQVHVEYIRTFFPDAGDKTFLYGTWPAGASGRRGIPDPVGRSVKFFRKIYDELDRDMNSVASAVGSMTSGWKGDS